MSKELAIEKEDESGLLRPASTGRGDSGRMVQLDILRGFAIMLVIFRHHIIYPKSTGIFSVVDFKLYTLGWSGVDLFFVLSGFLIGGLLFTEMKHRQSIDVKRFLIRRAFKIWPGYLLLLCVITAIKALNLDFYMFDRNVIPSLASILPAFFHLQNYLVSPRLHIWSLAVEEHFYLLLPFVLLILTTRGKDLRGLGAIPWIGVFLLAACLAMRIFVRHQPGWILDKSLFPTHLRIDSLFCGVTLAYFFHIRPELLEKVGKRTGALLLAALVLVGPLFFGSLRATAWVTEWGFTMLALGYSCLLLAFIYAKPNVGILGKFISSGFSRVLAFIGFYSYSIYLWHIDIGKEPLGYLVRHKGLFAHLSPSLRFLAVETIYVCLAIAMGVIMNRLVEKPSLALRDRLFPSYVSNREVVRQEAETLPT